MANSVWRTAFFFYLLFVIHYMLYTISTAESSPVEQYLSYQQVIHTPKCLQTEFTNCPA